MSKSSVRAYLAVAMIFGAATAANSQVVTTSRTVFVGDYLYAGTSLPEPGKPLPESPVAILTRLQDEGRWFDLQGYGLELLNGIRDKVPNIKPHLGNVRRDYYNLVWLSEKDGKPSLNRVLIHKGLRPEHATRLPGVRQMSPDANDRVRDIFLSDNPLTRLRSTYTSTEIANPLTAQLPDVIARWNILGFLSAAAGAALNTVPAVTVSINEVDLPFPRADVVIKDTAVVRLTSADFMKGLKKAGNALAVRQARSSPCAQLLIERATTALEGAASSPECQEEKTCKDLVTAAAEGHDIGTDEARARLAISRPCSSDTACTARLTAALNDAYAKVIPAHPSCSGASGPPLPYDPVLTVEDRFTQVIASRSATIVSGENKVSNRPDSRLAFGLMSAYLSGEPRPGLTRVKLEEGLITPAGLERLASMVVLEIHPIGYDPNLVRPSFGERFRLFAGGVITPDFGISTGLGFGLVRGLSVNVGTAWLFVNTIRANDEVGKAPQNTLDPFQTRRTRMNFIGLAYAFK